MRGKRNAFLTPLRAEKPRRPMPSHNEGYAEMFEEAARRLEPDDYFSLRDLLFPIAREVLGLRTNIDPSGRAVDYMKGRICWQLGIAKRPPRGWREEGRVRSLGDSIYLLLDDEARRVLDFWARLKWTVDPKIDQALLAEGNKVETLQAALRTVRQTSWAASDQVRLRLSLLAS